MAEEVITFNVDFHCISNSNESLAHQTLTIKPSCKVSDMARIIEEAAEIPESQMRLEMNSVVLGRNKSLKELSMRSGDTLVVYYYARADCREIIKCIQWMENLLAWLENWNWEDCGVPVNANAIIDCLQELSFAYFSPWLAPTKYINKLYFISKDGLTLITKIMNILLDIPADWLDHELQLIESSTLGILWNITENEYILKAVAKSGGVEVCIRALSRLPIPECRHFPEESHIEGVKETMRKSLGALANLCELPEIRLTIASNKKAIGQMLSITLSPSFDVSVVHRVVMIFLDLSYTRETHSHLILQDEFFLFMKTSTVFGLIGYHKAVLFAILLCRSPQYFDKNNKHFVCEMLRSFLKTANYKTLSIFEKDREIFWGTISPLVKALYQKEDKQQTEEVNFFAPCKLTLLLALLALLSREYHCEVLVKENMIDFVVCLPWYTTGVVQERAMELVCMIRRSPDIQYQPPSLLNICKAAVSMYYCGLDDVTSLSVPELASKLWDMYYV